MTRALTAGLAYVALVFAAGFALGSARVLLLAPRLGETGAVLLELPVMLAVSWLACGWIVARLRVPGGIGARLAMGGVAFAVLMAAELGVSLLAFGRSLSEHLANYRKLPALLGLLAQVAFALFPLMAGRRGRPGAG